MCLFPAPRFHICNPPLDCFDAFKAIHLRLHFPIVVHVNDYKLCMAINREHERAFSRLY